MMIQTILQIEKQVYPFQENAGQKDLVKVEDIQCFSCLKDLQQKKSEMQKKTKLIDNPYLIKLLKIYQQDLNLHYIYEYVPYSFQNYIQKHYLAGKQEILDINQKLFIKKITYELMLLVSSLVNTRIQVQLSVENLGFTDDEKLKLYMSAKCRMGHKTEVSLVSYYKSCKQKILNFIEKQFEKIKHKEEEPPNFVIKGNKLLFSEAPLNESLYQSSRSFRSQNENVNRFNGCESGIFDQSLYQNEIPFKKSTSSCINQKNQRPSFLRQTQSPQFGRTFNFSQSKNSNSSSHKAKTHKNSFHFGVNTPRRQKTQADNEDAKSFTHSKSIRIELEQRLDPSLKKKRKDSYKVKITSCHQYEMDDCNPQEIFGKNPQASGDIFEHFTSQAKRFEKKDKQQTDNYFDGLSQPGVFKKKDSMPDHGCSTTQVSSVRNLEEKVRIAKEKAVNILNHYMKAKKMSSYGQ